MAEKVGTVFLVIGGVKGFQRGTDHSAVEKIIEGCVCLMPGFHKSF